MRGNAASRSGCLPQAGPSLPGCALGEYPRQHYPTQSQVPSGLCSSRASRMLGSLSLASSGHFHAPRPGGRRFPPAHGSAPLHRRPPRRPPPAAKMLRAPACGIMFVPHIMPPAPKISAAALQESASGASNVSATSEARAATSGRYGVKCCPRHSRRFLRVCVRTSLRRSVQLGHSCGIT